RPPVPGVELEQGEVGIGESLLLVDERLGHRQVAQQDGDRAHVPAIRAGRAERLVGYEDAEAGKTHTESESHQCALPSKGFVSKRLAPKTSNAPQSAGRRAVL